LKQPDKQVPANDHQFLTRSRLVVLIVTCSAVALVGCSAPPAPGHVPDPDYWPTAQWRTSTPEALGLDSGKLADMLAAVGERGIPIHSLQVIRNGYLALDAYFYPYDRHDLHDTASVTKSVTATLVGMAVAKGFVPSVKTPILSLFPGKVVANRDPGKEAITVEDLLTMRPGLACEEVPGEPTLREMRQRPDWVQFMLDRPMARASGKKFVYCSPGMHVLSAALTHATGETALDFARHQLFAPLGIQDVAWPADAQGNNFGWAISIFIRSTWPSSGSSICTRAGGTDSRS
jgi:CubicO group peptidase (beta-lactamase class C family)